MTGNIPMNRLNKFSNMSKSAIRRYIEGKISYIAMMRRLNQIAKLEEKFLNGKEGEENGCKQ